MTATTTNQAAPTLWIEQIKINMGGGRPPAPGTPAHSEYLDRYQLRISEVREALIESYRTDAKFASWMDAIRDLVGIEPMGFETAAECFYQSSFYCGEFTPEQMAEILKSY